MEQKIGYKVLTRNRMSFIISPEKGGLQYKINEEVKPQTNCGPLCLFSSYHHAAALATSWLGGGHASIVKCKYIESKQKHIFKRNQKSKLHLNDLAFGTVLADSVTCLE